MFVFNVIRYGITHTFDFTGYAQRRVYWTWLGFYILSFVLVNLLGTVANITWLPTVYSILLLISNFSFLVRRLRDAGFGANDTYNTGIFYFFIPIIGQLLLLKWLLSPSTASNNSWTLSQVEYQQLQRDGFTS